MDSWMDGCMDGYLVGWMELDPEYAEERRAVIKEANA